ncbi:MAG: GNAT family N-acetyltransferase [Longimicrobiales bacterium]
MTKIAFRPMRLEDLPLMHEWLGRPHIASWWDGLPTLDEVIADYRPVISEDGPHKCYFAVADGEPIGFIQSYVPALAHAEGWWLDEHDTGVRGIDQFLCDSESLGKGLGTAMVSAFIDYLFEDPAVTRIQTDPSPENARAIRCYEKAGFHATGVIETLDGRALLMYCDRPSRRVIR